MVDNDCPEAPTVPLALPLSGAYGHQALPPAYFPGGSGAEAFAVYKVTGLRYSVRFDSNLGDLESLAVDQALLPGSAPDVAALVEGALPSGATLGGLPTGLPFATRVTAASALHAVGYGNASAGVSVAHAAGPPGAPGGLRAGLALHVDEVQEVTVGATHVDEVQRVESSSERVPEVQLVSLLGDEGTKVRGSFALFFPEVQTVTLSSRNEVTNGTYMFTVAHYETAAEQGLSGGLVRVEENTTCVGWHATPQAVQAALEATAFIGRGGVEVTRGGDGSEHSPAAPFGYELEVRFVGASVYGNVPELTVSSRGCPLRDVARPGGPSSVAVATKAAPAGGPPGEWRPKHLSGGARGRRSSGWWWPRARP